MTTDTAIRQNMGAVEWAQLPTLLVLWGATYFFVAVAVDTYTPLVIVLVRVGLAALALNLLLVWSKNRTVAAVVADDVPAEYSARPWTGRIGQSWVHRIVQYRRQHLETARD